MRKDNKKYLKKYKIDYTFLNEKIKLFGLNPIYEKHE